MKWFVLKTKARCEKKVEEQLLSIGINAYCPTYSKIKRWSDRKKRISVPLLPSIVFVKIEEKDTNKVFHSPGVLGYMFWLGKRAVVKQYEIDILNRYLVSGDEFLNKKISDINVGDSFSISSLNNMKGIVNRISNNNIWIYLNSTGFDIKLKLA